MGSIQWELFIELCGINSAMCFCKTLCNCIPLRLGIGLAVHHL